MYDWAPFDKTEKCLHPIHPAHPAASLALKRKLEGKFEEEDDGKQVAPLRAFRCPACTMHAHLNFVKILLDKWNVLGGPYRLRTDLTEEEISMLGQTNKAYYRAKLDMINTVHGFEDWAKAEEKWEAENPTTDVSAIKKYTAGEAVEIFRRDLTPALPAAAVVAQTKLKKTLSFTEDTQESSPHRPFELFSRRYYQYEPRSPHSCTDEEGWLDSSFMYDHLYTIGQCRILRVEYDRINRRFKYRDLNSGKDKGNNVHVERLRLQVKSWLETEVDREMWVKYLARASDIFHVMHTNREYNGDDFNQFEISTGLKGSPFEEYARLIGDLNEEEPPAEVFARATFDAENRIVQEPLRGERSGPARSRPDLNDSDS